MKNCKFVSPSMGFVDLHTHLMGMGNSDFWLDRIDGIQDFTDQPPDSLNSFMKYKKLWNNNENRFANDDNDVITELGNDKILLDRFTDAAQCFLKNKFDSKDNLKFYQFIIKQENFSRDIVFSLRSLLEAFQIPLNEHMNINDAIHILMNLLSLNEMPQDYIIWNAKEQKFDYRYGYQSSAIFNSSSNKYLLKYAFTITWEDDNAYSENIHIAQSYLTQNNFTPLFYPARFSLRDEIVCQDLETLKLLLENVLSNYSNSNVNYVEFSISANDIADRPWMLDILKSRIDNKGVTYRFLAGFNRTSVNLNLNETTSTDANDFHIFFFLWKIMLSIFHYYWSFLFDKIYILDKMNSDELIKELLKSLNQRNIAFNNLKCHPIQCKELAFSRETYSNHLKILKKIVKRRDEDIDEFSKWIVGFDLMGDEHGYPYCPFFLPEFIEFAKEMHETNPRFGFRIHAGEFKLSAVEEIKKAQECHIDILYDTIKLIDKNKYNEKIPIRIGHGIAFVSSEKNNEILDHFKENIPIEMNFTSNNILVHSRHHIRFMINKLYEDKIPFFLEQMMMEFLIYNVDAICLTSH